MTSEYLLARFPFLAGQRGWEKFASQFDKAECVEKRAKAREVHEGAEPSPEVRKLRQRCSHIINQAFWGKWESGNEDKWGGFFLDGYERFTTEGEKIARFIGIAEALAEDVETLFSDSAAGERMRGLLHAESKRLRLSKLPQGEREIRIGHEAYCALTGFIEREERLPSKHKLNLEAGRRSRVKVKINYDRPIAYGTVVEEVWRVQCCKKWHGIPQLDEPETGYTIELVDCRGGMKSTWDALRWSETTFSKEVVQPFGFAGLPRHLNP